MSISEPTSVRESLELSLSVSPLAQLVVSRDGYVRAASPPAGQLVGVPTGISGLPVIAVGTAESAAAVVRLVEQACDTGQPSAFLDLQWVPLDGSGPRWLSGGVVPLADPDGTVVAAIVTITPIHERALSLRADNAELKRDNSELRSIADELRTRTHELNVVAIFLQSVLTSLRGAVVVADATGAIRFWNAEAERLWGIPRRAAMQSLLADLDLGVPPDLLREGIQAGMRGESVADMALSLNRADPDADRSYIVNVTPLLGPGGSVAGVTLVFVARPTLM